MGFGRGGFVASEHGEQSLMICIEAPAHGR